ncbi:MAG: glycosyltransferase family 4 protein [Promethearchaeota archaeon]
MIPVYLEAGIGGKLHSLYKELISYPPEGYIFHVKPGTIDNGRSFHTQNMASTIPRTLYDTVVPFGTFAYSWLNKWTNGFSGLIYSSQHLFFGKKPWIVDMEFATALVSYAKIGSFKHSIQKSLVSRNCKKIIPWTDMGKKSLLNCLDCKKFEDKIETVHLAVRPKNFIKKYNNEKVKILFVGTGNPWNASDSFYIKGGREVLMAFKYLSERYNNLELVIRSNMPDYVLTKWTKNQNITIINKTVPWCELSEIFQTSDVFLFPAHITPGMVLLDAMSYELPVITTDLWANPEMVEDGETGFLVKKSEKIPYVKKNLIPNWGTRHFASYISNPDPDVVQDVVDKTSILIEDEKLRRRMGRAARKEIETGKFSIKERNEHLKKIFNEALDD